MAAWPEEPGLITSKAPKSAYSWLVEEVGVKYSQGSICSTQNYDQCSGDMRNAPWRPGMLMDGLPMTELPGFPEDAYYDNEYNSWINSDGYGINWMPYYEKFCEAL